MSTSTWSITFENNTPTPVASTSISHMEVNSSGTLSNLYQWMFLSLPANSVRYSPSGTFLSVSGLSNDWTIVVTDQNNRSFGCIVHSSVSSSPTTGTVAITLATSGGNYTVNINDGHGNNNTFTLGALNTTYGF